MRGPFLATVFPLALVVLATTTIAQEEAAPQNDWMIHMDRADGTWRYVPERPVLVPGGIVQLMVFGNGQFSLILEGTGEGADISSTEGSIRTAELVAPAAAGEYAFHDKYHPEARGVLVVRERAAAAAVGPAIGVVPGGYESRFAPARLEVAPGAEVLFRANGTFGHNLQASDGSFSAGDLAPGQERAFRAPTTPGEHAFECRFHKEQGMVGTLVVTGPAETPVTNDTNGIGLAALLAALAACAVLARRRAA